MLNGLVVNPVLKINHKAAKRNGSSFELPKYTVSMSERSFLNRGTKLYNSFPRYLNHLNWLMTQQQVPDDIGT